MTRSLRFISFLALIFPAVFPLAQGPIDPVITIRLDTPEITRVDNNRIYWTRIQHAESYRLQ